MKIQDYLKKEFNYNPDVNDLWIKYIDLWRSWYIGKVKKFHTYYIYNGKKKLRRSRSSMNMAKKCCEDWADLLFNEKCKVSLADENSDKELKDILNKNDFWKFMNEAVEKSGASGTGAVVVSVKDMEYDETTETLRVSNAETLIEYVDVDRIYPITWKGRKITECAFASHRTERGKNYVFLSVHLLDSDGMYIIKNKVFEEINGSIFPVEDENIAEEFKTGSSRPWFAILSPQQNNNIYPESPWGVPYFANAIDTLEAIDLSFDCLQFELSSSRKRTFVRQEAMQADLRTGEIVETFDPNDVTLYVLPDGLNKEDLIQNDSSEIRSSAICETISKNLALFSSQVGFGYDRYKFEGASLKTATEVISQNSEMYRRKKKHETALENVLFDIIEAVAYASTVFGKHNINTNGLAIQFDQSIVEDKEAISNRALREISAGVLSKVEYRMTVYGEDEETAKKKIAEIDKNEPSLKTLIGMNNNA